MFQEATLEQYFYYLRRVEGDTSEKAQLRRSAFERELGALLAHLEHLSRQKLPHWQWREENDSRRASQFLGSTGWLESAPQDGHSCFTAAYIYGDVYCLQVGYCQSGLAAPQVFASLREAAWEPSAAEHLLGSSSYLCGIAEAKNDVLAAQALAAFTSREPGDVISTHVGDFDAWLYGAPAQPDALALFYPDPEREAQAGEMLLNNRVPRLEVYRHKIDRQLAWCEQNFALLSAQSRALGDLLDELEPSMRVDKTLARRLARQFRVYEHNLEMLSERQTTIETNLHNLDVVLKEFGPLADDHLLNAIQTRAWERRAQLEETLDRSGRIRRRAESALTAIVASLGLQRPADLLQGADEVVHAENLIRQGGFPSGVLPPYEADLPFPKIEIVSDQTIHLDESDIRVLQHVYRGYGELRVLKEFHGGATCRHALLTRPIGADGYEKALRVTKIGAELELRTECENYRRVVADSLPFFSAPLEWERYYAEDNLAGLSYLFVGGGGLGETLELEEYYGRAEADQNIDRVIGTLSGLLEHELGEQWYGKFHVQENRSFEAEYSPKLFEHLRLRLRPDSPDALWMSGNPPGEMGGYRWVEAADIPSGYPDIQPGTLLAFDGLVVNEFRKDIAVLWDKQSQGIVIRVVLNSQADLALGRSLGAEVGVRGEVVFNRHGRMEEVVRNLFSTPLCDVESETISLPGVVGIFPNPLHLYPKLLKKKMPEFRKSYVHGDLHMRNVLVDGWGIGRLIDFAEVSERHNLFDFIRLEGYLRYLTLGSFRPLIPLPDYIQFEESLTATTLGKSLTSLPHNRQLRFAQEVILEIRRIARKYLACESDLADIYLPALFLHCLGFTRYDQKSVPYGIQLTFATACVLGWELA